MSYNLELDHGAIQNIVGGASQRAAERASASAVARARSNAPVDTGALRESIRADNPYQVGDMIYIVEIYSPLDYAIYQERGTRGSTGNPLLVFRPKGSGTLVFARSTGPVPATRFMERAINATSAGDFY